jgi:hypothetical protein
MRVHRSNCGSLDRYTIDVRLRTPNETVSETRFRADRSDCNRFRTLSINASHTLPKGAQDLRLEVAIDHGPSWTNAKVDRVTFEPGTPAPEAPSQGPSETASTPGLEVPEPSAKVLLGVGLLALPGVLHALGRAARR